MSQHDGIVSVEFVTLLSGDYSGSITVEGVSVLGSPYPVLVSANDLDASMCTAEGAGLGSAVAGYEGKFAVISYDSLGNRRNVGGYIFDVTLSYSGIEPSSNESVDVSVDAHVIDNGDGSYSVSYVLEAPARHRRDAGLRILRRDRRPPRVACLRFRLGWLGLHSLRDLRW